MSENLSSAIKAGEELDERLNTPISQHIQSIEIIVFKRYFFELKEQEVAFAQNQFSTASNVLSSWAIHQLDWLAEDDSSGASFD